MRAGLDLEDETSFRIVRHAPTALVLRTLGRGQCTLSERAARLLGYADAGQIPGDAFERVHPDDRARWEAHEARLRGLRDGEAACVERRVRRADGAWLPLRWEEAPYARDERGAVAAVLGVLSEVAPADDSAETWRLAEAIAGVGAFDFRPELDGAIGSEGYFRLIGVQPPPEGVHRVDQFMAAVHPEDREIVTEAIARAAAGPYPAEYRLIRPDGSVRWVRAVGAQIDPAGRVVGAVIDITDSKAVERAIRRTAEFWRAAIDGQPAFLAVLDLNGAVVEVNRPALDRAGLDRGDVIGRRFSQCGWWAWSAQAQAEVDGAVALARIGQTSRFDAGLLTAHGAVAPVDLTFAPLREAAGAVTHVVASGIDVSERVAAEARLRDGLAELQSIYDAAPIGLCVIDREMRWVRINDRLAEINGYPPEAHVGRRVAELLPNINVEAVLRRVLETGETLIDVEIEGETPAKPGVRRYWRESFLPLRDAMGRVFAVNVVCEEITDRKAVEDRQRLLVRELGHRVKNTLALVQAITRQTAREARTVDDYQSALSGRLRALSAAHDLVFESDWQGASLNALILRALGGHTPLDRLDLEVAPVRVPAEMAQNLALTFHELATNAMKYGAFSVPEGRVVIEAGTLSNTLDIAWTERGGPPVIAPRVKGFGATLLSRVLVYEHGGSVDLDWRPEGLQVRMRLPLAPVENEP